MTDYNELDIFQQDKALLGEYMAEEPLPPNATEQDKSKRAKEILERPVDECWKPYMVLREIAGVDLVNPPDISLDASIRPRITTFESVREMPCSVVRSKCCQNYEKGDYPKPNLTLKARALMTVEQLMLFFGNGVLHFPILSRLKLVKNLGWRILGWAWKVSDKMYVEVVTTTVSGVFKCPTDEQILAAGQKSKGACCIDGPFRRHDCPEKK